jgi:hypothetical protein
MFESEPMIREVGLRNFERAVMARAQLFHASAVDIEANDGHTGASKCSRNRQPNVAKSDHGNFSIVRRH